LTSSHDSSEVSPQRSSLRFRRVHPAVRRRGAVTGRNRQAAQGERREILHSGGIAAPDLDQQDSDARTGADKVCPCLRRDALRICAKLADGQQRPPKCGVDSLKKCFPPRATYACLRALRAHMHQSSSGLESRLTALQEPSASPSLHAAHLTPGCGPAEEMVDYGDVRFWDSRCARPLRTFKNPHAAPPRVCPRDACAPTRRP
jgi:hypothetical protein